MRLTCTVITFVLVMIAGGVFFGCAEVKLGMGPFKAASVEVGPGGVEAKGPSAGPLKTRSAEIGPGSAEMKGAGAGRFKSKD